MKENRAINIYLVVISIHDQVEALGVGKTDQGESRLHSMRTWETSLRFCDGRRRVSHQDKERIREGEIGRRKPRGV